MYFQFLIGIALAVSTWRLLVISKKRWDAETKWKRTSLEHNKEKFEKACEEYRNTEGEFLVAIFFTAALIIFFVISFLLV